jgi:hypothetical protein
VSSVCTILSSGSRYLIPAILVVLASDVLVFDTLNRPAAALSKAHHLSQMSLLTPSQIDLKCCVNVRCRRHNEVAVFAEASMEMHDPPFPLFVRIHKVAWILN